MGGKCLDMNFEMLIQQPESQRDEKWEAEFLTQFAQLKVELVGDQAQTGPDGFPYFYVKTGPEGQESVRDVVQWLSNKGIGLVVNPQKMMPDYVFTYGMIWNYVETGRFLSPEPLQSPESADPGGLISGPPSEKYLPPYVRGVLREFLQAQGFAAPKVLVVSSQDYRLVDLVISADSLAGLAKSEHVKFAEMVSWFLPLHYNLVVGEAERHLSFHSL